MRSGCPHSGWGCRGLPVLWWAPRCCLCITVCSAGGGVGVVPAFGYLEYVCCEHWQSSPGVDVCFHFSWVNPWGCVCVFLRLRQTCPKGCAPLLPPAVFGNIPCPHHTWWAVFTGTCPVGVRMLSSMALSHISLQASDLGVFSCVTGHLLSSSMK